MRTEYRIQDLAAAFADWFVQDGGTVVDLGASTGETLLRIQKRNPLKKFDVLGYGSLKRGGGFFVVEKVLGSIPEFQDITQSLYWDMKLDNGLSPTEVLNKTNLQRRSIRWIIGDECWRWPSGHMAEAEEDVLPLADGIRASHQKGRQMAVDADRQTRQPLSGLRSHADNRRLSESLAEDGPGAVWTTTRHAVLLFNYELRITKH